MLTLQAVYLSQPDRQLQLLNLSYSSFWRDARFMTGKKMNGRNLYLSG